MAHVKTEKSRAFSGYALGKGGSSRAGYVLGDSKGRAVAQVRGLARPRLIASLFSSRQKKTPPRLIEP
jgi:hypothetical protein